jgi:hypothetical protein
MKDIREVFAFPLGHGITQHGAVMHDPETGEYAVAVVGKRGRIIRGVPAPLDWMNTRPSELRVMLGYPAF